MSAAAVELKDVSFSRGADPVLEQVNLRVEPQDYLAILGPNGGGKTTLLKVILGLIEPDRGQARIFGEPPRKARRRIGYLPQALHFDLDFPVRVLDVVLMGLIGMRRVGRDERTAAREALEVVEMDGLASRPIGALSGGQLQRVLIARALVREPKLLLLDEPTASLDERVGRDLWELLEELSHEMAVIVVAHATGAISRYVRRVASLNRTLHDHPSGKLTSEVLEAGYGCPVDLLVHGSHPHRMLGEHDHHEDGS